MVHGTSLLSRLVRFGMTGIGVTALHVMVAASLVELSHAGPAAANGIASSLGADISKAAADTPPKTRSH